MSDVFDKDNKDLEEKNAVPKTEDENNAGIENSKNNFQDFEDKEESKEGDELLFRQKERKDNEKETPSDAPQNTQGNNEGKKTGEEAQAYKKEAWGDSDILKDKAHKKNNRKRNIGIGLAAVIIAIAIMVTTLGGALVMVAVDTAILVWEVVDDAFDVFVYGVNVDDTSTDESNSQKLPDNDAQTGVMEDIDFTVDTSEPDGDMSVAQVVGRTKDSVVLITAIGYDRFGRQTSGTGSGVVITEDGYMVTNNHVVEGAVQVFVEVPNKGEFEAEIVKLDRSADVALLHINTTGLSFATLGDSDDLVMGQEVVALGYPLGSAQTVTAGLVSALDVKVQVDGVNMSLIRTNAAINPGNSGGGLFDRSGRLIGVVNAKQVDTDIEGLGYAIPINTVVDSVKK